MLPFAEVLSQPTEQKQAVAPGKARAASGDHVDHDQNENSLNPQTDQDATESFLSQLAAFRGDVAVDEAVLNQSETSDVENHDTRAPLTPEELTTLVEIAPHAPEIDLGINIEPVEINLEIEALAEDGLTLIDPSIVKPDIAEIVEATPGALPLVDESAPETSIVADVKPDIQDVLPAAAKPDIQEVLPTATKRDIQDVNIGQDLKLAAKPIVQDTPPVETAPTAITEKSLVSRGLGAEISALNLALPETTTGRDRSAAITELTANAQAGRGKEPETQLPQISADRAKIDLSALKPTDQVDITQLDKQNFKFAPATLSQPALSTPTQVGPEFQIGLTQTISSTAPSATPTQSQFVHLANNANPVQKVAHALASVTHGQDKLVVRLDPPELGRVSIEFQFDAQRNVTAVISAENADIGSQLREKSEFFMKALKEAGFEDVNLSFDTQSDTSDFGEDTARNGEPSGVSFYQNDSDMIESAIVPRAGHGLQTATENLNILL